jgi:hypothetical protein
MKVDAVCVETVPSQVKSKVHHGNHSNMMGVSQLCVPFHRLLHQRGFAVSSVNLSMPCALSEALFSVVR